MQPQKKNGPTVYVVDDDQDVRDGLQCLIQSIGLECITFMTAADFLSAKIADEVSCLILDVRLPGLSGLDFQLELAKAQIEMPIVFITGYGDIPMTVKAMKAGAIEFFTKPIREQDLLDAIYVALDRDRAKRRDLKTTLDLRTRFQALSPREQDVMCRVCTGLMNKQVAAEIGISEITVKVHRHNVMKKLGARSLAELVRMADRLKVPSEQRDRHEKNSS
jgi:FixJ family two-component response regulator